MFYRTNFASKMSVQCFCAEPNSTNIKFALRQPLLSGILAYYGIDGFRFNLLANFPSILILNFQSNPWSHPIWIVRTLLYTCFY